MKPNGILLLKTLHVIIIILFCFKNLLITYHIISLLKIPHIIIIINHFNNDFLFNVATNWRSWVSNWTSLCICWHWGLAVTLCPVRVLRSWSCPCCRWKWIRDTQRCRCWNTPGSLWVIQIKLICMCESLINYNRHSLNTFSPLV